MPKLILTFALAIGLTSITVAQNIGIGTTNPLELLHLRNGDFRLDDGYSLKFTTDPGDTAGVRFYNKLVPQGAWLYNTNANMVNLTRHDTVHGVTYNFGTGKMFVGRDFALTSAEKFGVSTATTSFGGMNIETYGGQSGRPFYGYAIDSTTRAYHYYDGASGQWRLVMGGALRMFVDSTSGDIAMHGNTLFVDGDNDRVGIGTNFPMVDLHAMGTLRVEHTTPTLQLYSSGLSKGFFKFDANDISIGNETFGNINFVNPSDTVVIIDGSGNMGIGTTDPQSDLHVIGIARIDNPTPQLRFHNDSIFTAFIQTSAEKMTISNKLSGNLEFRTNDIMRLAVTNEGDVGVGTTLPYEKLHVKGNIRVDNSYPDIKLYNGNTQYGGLLAGPEHLVLAKAGSNGDLRFLNGGENRIVIDPDGNVGIGEAYPDYTLHVNGTAAVEHATKPELLLKRGSTSIGSIWGFGANMVISNNLVSGNVAVRTADTDRMVIDGSGLVSVSGDMTIAQDLTAGGTLHVLDDLNRVGIGTAGPSATLDVQGSFEVDGSTFKIKDLTNQVFIGTNVGATGYKLCVDGKIISEELFVQMSADWPDYVFQEGYDLPDIGELKNYISEEGHLPGVPSAAEVNLKNGIEVGEMNRVLLEKIEELTLYIIQQDERIAALESQNH